MQRQWDLKTSLSVYIGRLIGRQMDTEENRSYISTAPTSTQEMGRLRDVSTYFIKTLDFNYMIIGIIFESNLFKKCLLKYDPLQYSTLNIEVMSKFASMLIESERVIDYFMWSKNTITTHSGFLNPRDLGCIIFKKLLETVANNAWEYISQVLLILFADEDPFKIRTISIWLYRNQQKICPRSEPMLLKDPSSFVYTIPTHTHTFSCYNLSTFHEKQQLIKKILFSCVKTKYYSVLPFPRSLILPAYKSTNTLDTLTMASNLPKPITIGTERMNYSIAVLRNLYIEFYRSLDEVTQIKIPFIQHIGRIIGCISSAATKYFEILKLLDISPQIKPTISLHLAEGSGSVLWLYANYFKCAVGYNTLMSPEVDNRKHQSLRIPPRLAFLQWGMFEYAALFRTTI